MADINDWRSMSPTYNVNPYGVTTRDNTGQGFPQSPPAAPAPLDPKSPYAGYDYKYYTNQALASNAARLSSPYASVTPLTKLADTFKLGAAALTDDVRRYTGGAFWHALNRDTRFTPEQQRMRETQAAAAQAASTPSSPVANLPSMARVVDESGKDISRETAMAIASQKAKAGMQNQATANALPPFKVTDYLNTVWNEQYDPRTGKKEISNKRLEFVPNANLKDLTPEQLKMLNDAVAGSMYSNATEGKDRAAEILGLGPAGGLQKAQAAAAMAGIGKTSLDQTKAALVMQAAKDMEAMYGPQEAAATKAGNTTLFATLRKSRQAEFNKLLETIFKAGWNPLEGMETK